MYQIELIDRSTCWKGDKGVVMHCQVRRYWYSRTPPDPLNPDYCTVGDSRKYDVTVWGTDEPTVWVKAMDASSGYIYPPIITDPVINEDVRQWVYSSPVLADWYEEAARYRAALAKVDLPYPPEDVQSEGKYLTYRFTISGGREYDIALVLEVDADSTRVTMGLHEAGNADDSYVHIGTASITGSVTLHRVRCVVGDTIYDFINDLRDMVRVVMHGSW